MSIAQSRSQSGAGLTLALLALAQLIISIDYNIVYVALPDIGRDLDFTAGSLQWVVSAYAVGFGGFLLLGGRAVDRLGARRIFILALLLYAVASLAGGLVPDARILVAARVAQGLGGALLFPATLALLTTGFPEGPERNRAMAIWGVAGSSGVVVGAVLGGVLTTVLGWEWVFFVNVPLGLGAALLASWVLPADPPRSGNYRAGFDLPGALFATSGATLLVFGLVSGPEAGWWSIRGAGAIATGALLFALFLLLERRTHDPLLPLRLLGQRNLAVATAALFVFVGGVNTLHYLFFLYLQDIHHYGPLQAGLAFLPTSAAAMLSSGRLLPLFVSRWGLRATLLVGVAGTGLGIALFAAGLTADGGYGMLLPGIITWGLFAGMTFPALFMAASGGVAAAEQGVASALASTSQQIGGAVGLALMVAVANAGLGAQPSTADTVAGLRLAGFAAAVLTIAGTLLITRYRNGSNAVSTSPATEPDQRREAA